MQSKTLLHFLAQISTDQDEIGHGIEAMQVEHPDAAFEIDLSKQGKITAFLLNYVGKL